MPIGAAANELMTSISHASAPIARRRRERASRRSEKVMKRAYPCDLTRSTLEVGSAVSRLAETHVQRDLVAGFQAGHGGWREMQLERHAFGFRLDQAGLRICFRHGRWHAVHAHHAAVHTLHVRVHRTHLVHAACGRAVLGYGDTTDDQREPQ